MPRRARAETRIHVRAGMGADRRRHVVELTDEGRLALERAERAPESLGEALLAALNKDERATLRSLLSRALEPALR